MNKQKSPIKNFRKILLRKQKFSKSLTLLAQILSPKSSRIVVISRIKPRKTKADCLIVNDQDLQLNLSKKETKITRS